MILKEIVVLLTYNRINSSLPLTASKTVMKRDRAILRVPNIFTPATITNSIYAQLFLSLSLSLSSPCVVIFILGA